MSSEVINESDLARACLLFLQGRTVRSLATQFNTPKSTLHYHLVKKVGTGCQRRDSGTIAVIDEHLKSPYLSRNQKNSVRRWMAANMNQIIELDATNAPRLLTLKREQALTNQECGSRCDFRANLKVIGGGDAA